MTGPQLSPAPELTEAEKATVERFDAAEEPEEVVVERVARAMHEVPAQPGVYGRIPWDRLIEQHRDTYRQMARAALTALRGDRAPLAGQPTPDEDSNTADELAAAGLRACCGQPSERHCQ